MQNVGRVVQSFHERVQGARVIHPCEALRRLCAHQVALISQCMGERIGCRRICDIGETFGGKRPRGACSTLEALQEGRNGALAPADKLTEGAGTCIAVLSLEQLCYLRWLSAKLPVEVSVASGRAHGGVPML